MPLALFAVIFLHTIFATVPPVTHQHWSIILVCSAKAYWLPKVHWEIGILKKSLHTEVLHETS